MSNNVVPQSLMIPCSQVSQLETMTGRLDSTMQMGSEIGEFSHQQFSIPNTQIGSFGSQQLPLSNIQPQKMVSKSNNLGPVQVSALNKRKAPLESSSVPTVSHNLSMPNKRMVQMANRPWLQQSSQMQPVPLGSQQTQQKKLVRTESMPKKPGPSPRSQKTQTLPSPKARIDSSDSVRSKMTEQLAAALELVLEQHDNPQNKDAAFVADHASGESEGMLPSKEDSAAQKGSDGWNASEETFVNDGSATFPKFEGLDFQSSIVLPDEDVPFSDSLFARDEFLQGNGLSWVLDSDKEVAEEHEIQVAGKQDEEIPGKDERRQQPQSPKILASKIEAELFKLFGGVNKKYKEKGRSLLFNLKDRSNPELRERVMSGDIPPDRLCAMSAEELASKELSQWRQAKAEEFASMVVLPDSGLDAKRLVRKTHKGEFMVEFEQDGNPTEDVSAGANSIILPKREENQRKPKKEEAVKENRAALHRKRAGSRVKFETAGEKNNLEENEVFMIPPNDVEDAMHELMVDDGLTNLPPIVSLDEFMDSLDSEPPFVILPEAGASIPSTDYDELENASPRNPTSTAIEKDSDKDESKPVPDKDSNMDESISITASKSSEDSAKEDTSPSLGMTSGECVWEGALRLNVSSVTSVTGIYKSGEKTSAKEWPGMIEIKGRVRLAAFQKFLQELPLSRSRAIMVVHFCCKESSSEEERENIKEIAASYISDERVGIAEPTRGVELYLCPPHSNPLEMLCKILTKDQVDTLNAINDGLIGVIVWRKLVTPKHGSKKHHSSRRQDKDNNSNKTNVNSMTPKKPVPSSAGLLGKFPGSNKPEEEDDDDDVPPGFGPGVAVSTGDDDDLPEFNFSGPGTFPPSRFPSQNVSITPGTNRPVDQMRELIQKYGQSNSSSSPRNWKDNRGNGFPKWNDDDDDDIPEWQPSAPVQPIPRGQISNQFSGQHHQPLPPPPVNVMQSQKQRPLWAPPPAGQFYGAPPPPVVGTPAWHQDAPKK
ncbi:uncharacterized protein [Rutidosis leptorrhynchoides]|uniref:uncharacterized protein n=1 Tax=Rutidosis leptorrhynchoides TaxID=125765 RepID=UPI003A9A0097